MRRGKHAGLVWVPPEQAKAAAPRIRELRRGNGWSQRDLARKSGTAQSTVAFAESGWRPLTEGVAGALASALGTDLAGLLGGGAP